MLDEVAVAAVEEAEGAFVEAVVVVAASEAEVVVVVEEALAVLVVEALVALVGAEGASEGVARVVAFAAAEEDHSRRIFYAMNSFTLTAQ